ncbi:CobW family GTP-binding protein [Methylobacterium sp. CM6257]
MKHRLPAPATRCPLTVLGGFLGAGKTTLLNRLLTGARGRYAVLVNDFGAINVDAGLVADHDGKTLRLTNGCVCCSLADGFLDTLMRVLAEPGPFDHMVIEASGVGDPGAIAEIALVEPGLVLQGVIVLADAERLPALAADPRLGDTVARQIRAADLLVLNKCDLVDPSAMSSAREVLASLRPGVSVVETVDAALPEAVLVLDTVSSRDAARARFPIAQAVHETAFARFLYRRAGAFDRESLSRALAALPPSLLRLKGSLHLGDGPGLQLLQMVGRRWSLTPLPAQSNGGIELVGIATGHPDPGDAFASILDRALLRAEPPILQGDVHRCA